MVADDAVCFGLAMDPVATAIQPVDVSLTVISNVAFLLIVFM